MFACRAALAAVLVALAVPAIAQSMLGQSTPGQTQRLPPGLTPLGPIQPPLGSPPPASQAQPAGPAIESEPLPPVIPRSTSAPAALAPAAPGTIAPAPLSVPVPITPPSPAAPVTALPSAAPSAAPSTPALPPAAPSSSRTPAQPLPPGPALERDWISRPGITLQALDKVTARVTPLVGKTGETLRFGSLSIMVRACATRPSELPADAAGFIEVTDKGAATPVFRGWMLRSSPGLAIIEHPVYDLRITGCQG